MAHNDRNQDATVYMGNLDERVTDSLIWELMVQAGPVVDVHLPKDRVTQSNQGYGFCEFQTEEDADYAIKVMNMVKLYGKPIRINKASQDKKSMDFGANLFIGNLDPDVDEKLIYDTFAAFGRLVQPPKIGRDPETGRSKGYAFVNYDSFEASDAAIEAMNGQYLGQKIINVNYAFKKDGKGERHGSAAERLLAAQAKKNMPNGGVGTVPPAPASMPNRRFADVGVGGMPTPPAGPPPPPQMRPPVTVSNGPGYYMGAPGGGMMPPPTSGYAPQYPMHTYSPRGGYP